ncbi:MAG TPA: AAA family ATPase [Bacteroidales bacterium]|nr:AAA family ATPase [Bacteroidales bacterium]HPS49638.1 AAA family ATPase [Bacteroidales bacterium]
MISVSVFNNKGGVGKTTFVCNFASYLSIVLKRRVLIIDADPQCNATSYLLTEDELIDRYSKATGTIHDVTVPLRRGKGYFSRDLPIIKNSRFKVDLIPGDPRISLFEDFLATDWISAKNGDGRGLQTTLFIKDILQRERDNYDYIFFDVGPSLGAINRTVLIGSDYYILPMSSDIFSLRALENISISTKDWASGISDGLSKYQQTEGEEYSSDFNPKWTLKFCGYVTQQYTSKEVEGKKRPVRAYEKIISEIPIRINEYLAESFSRSDNFNPHLGEIPNLHSLIPLSQSAHVPIIALKGKHGVVGAHFYKIEEYSKLLKGISEIFINNIEKNDTVAE